MRNGEQAIARREGDGRSSFGAGERRGLHDDVAERDGGEGSEALCLFQEGVEEGLAVDGVLEEGRISTQRLSNDNPSADSCYYGYTKLADLKLLPALAILRHQLLQHKLQLIKHGG